MSQGTRKVNVVIPEKIATTYMFHFIDIKQALESGPEIPNIESYLNKAEKLK